MHPKLAEFKGRRKKFIVHLCKKKEKRKSIWIKLMFLPGSFNIFLNSRVSASNQEVHENTISLLDWLLIVPFI